MRGIFGNVLDGIGNAFSVRLGRYLFHGSFASSAAIAHVFETPAKISPQPTKSGRSANSGLHASAAALPAKTSSPAAILTCLSIDIAALLQTMEGSPESADMPPLMIDTLPYPASSNFLAAALARIPLLHRI